MIPDLILHLKALQELPLLEHSFDRLIRLLDDPRTSEHRLADAIAQDPSLTLKVLRLANSSYYGHSGGVAGLDRAIDLIGLTSVRGLMLSLHLLQSHQEEIRLPLERLAYHGYATAVAARVIARLQRRPQVSEIASAALLHDLGFLSRLQDLEENSGAAGWEERLLAEEQSGGVDHARWGYNCARAWNLPEVIAEAILHHHAPRPDSPHYEVVAIVHAADVLCHRHGLTHVGWESLVALKEEVAEHLGLSAEQWEQVIAETRLILKQAEWPARVAALERMQP